MYGVQLVHSNSENVKVFHALTAWKTACGKTVEKDWTILSVIGTLEALNMPDFCQRCGKVINTTNGWE